MVTFRRQDTGQPLHAGHASRDTLGQGNGGSDLYRTFGSANAYRFDLKQMPELRRLLHPACAELDS